MTALLVLSTLVLAGQILSALAVAFNHRMTPALEAEPLPAAAASDGEPPPSLLVRPR